MKGCALPRDLLIEILVKLPVKSLMRFKCVCKYFYDLIKNNQHLIHKFYEINREKYQCAIIEQPIGSINRPNQIFSLLYQEPESNEIECISVDFPNSKTRFVSCCHGMLCFILGKGDLVIRWSEISEDLSFDVLLWNPSIREIKALPSITVPNIPPPQFPVAYLMFEGFGFGVSNSMSWKVVMLWHFASCAVDNEPNYEFVMVCSQVGDGSWSWRQIDALPNVPVMSYQDFYFQGKYYWRVQQIGDDSVDLHRLLWFDLDDEVFGTIELPARREHFSFTVVNESIAMICCCPPENSNYIEIWLMRENENVNDVDWHKQWRIECGASIDKHEYWNPTGFGTWDESWFPIGIWSLSGRSHLLAFPYMSTYRRDSSLGGFPDGENYIPYLISVDLETQEMKMIYLTLEKKCVKFVSNSTGYTQVYKESNIDITQEWKDCKIFPKQTSYARVCSQSLQLM
ncbi:unnamed protein product [Cuscuta epithymum]|uniref:F-box domain-containing protein n=2 Tax=Cuscuta epithymum TaxID=186058 RepID=A0AAV0EC01_9ASTE|nr:unnamed protein product [Cuscuta epithymum]